jgi:hypothetical protein
VGSAIGSGMDLAPPYQGEIGKGDLAQISHFTWANVTVRDPLSVVVWCWMLVHQDDAAPRTEWREPRSGRHTELPRAACSI